MPNAPDTVPFIEDQLHGLDVRSSRMFGEACLYCDEKVVGFICDDTLFIKPSDAEPGLFDLTVPGKPYPGAKDYRSVPGDLLENSEWLRKAIQATADALPASAPKKPRKARGQ
ncbi:MAG: transcriptional regulator [Microbacteriaceae bacterium]|nr:transcriptional regulator [Microbacteriaceae bacterium]